MGMLCNVIFARGLEVITSLGTLERFGVSQPPKVPYEATGPLLA